MKHLICFILDTVQNQFGYSLNGLPREIALQNHLRLRAELVQKL